MRGWMEQTICYLLISTLLIVSSCKTRNNWKSWRKLRSKDDKIQDSSTLMTSDNIPVSGAKWIEDSLELFLPLFLEWNVISNSKSDDKYWSSFWERYLCHIWNPTFNCVFFEYLIKFNLNLKQRTDLMLVIVTSQISRNFMFDKISP